MNRRPERLADLLPGVVANLATRHLEANGEPAPMTTIWRYQLPLTDRVTLDLPAGAQLLSVGPPRSDAPHLDLWARVDAGARLQQRTFVVVGTGNPIPNDAGTFIGTTHSHDGALIWHVFEVDESKSLGGAA